MLRLSRRSHLTVKPNPNLVTDFDDELPYQRRQVHGETIITRDVPPPNWAELSIYTVASSLQAVARDGSGHLQVYFRTWLLHHSRDSPVESRDGQIRAQLMVNLHSRIRRICQDNGSASESRFGQGRRTHVASTC